MSLEEAVIHRLLEWADKDKLSKDCASNIEWTVFVRYCLENAHTPKCYAALSWIYEGHIHVNKDDTKSKDFREKAAKKGNPACCLKFAKETTNSIERVFFLQQAASDLISGPEAKYQLGKWYLKQEIENHKERAKQLFEEAGPKHAKALRRIGLLLEDQKDNVSAAFHLRQAADLGDVKASYKLYSLLFKNPTLPLSDSAFYYLYYAARAGHAKACAKIGFCYLYDPQTLPGGMTIAQDKVIGARWYEESAKGNYPRAFYRLGLIYLHGWANYPKSPLKALEFFRRAEQAGDKLVLLEMAKIYNVGLAGSLEADSKQAFEYYKKAADHQYCEAWYQLGKRHMEGIGTVKNTEQALVCWEKAATLGCKDSKASLVSYHIAAAAKYRA